MKPIKPGERRARKTPALGEIVGFLSSPSAYGLEDGAVEAKETHMSWVFLTPEHVFKLKKPFKAAFLDYSTVNQRERLCKEELRLNRRLAPDVYLQVTPITQADDGVLSINGIGKTIDWLVEMRRLPEVKMLDCAIRRGTARTSDIDRALAILFEFFKKAPPVAIEPDQYLATLEMQHGENRTLLCDESFKLSRNDVQLVIDMIEQTIEAAPDWLLEPVKSSRIIEGHGDLRPEHICLTDPPVIIDCLEFSRDLRLVDPFDELSYLALECRLLGADALADAVVGRYAKVAGETPSLALLDFYTVYRAAIRTRLSLGHIIDWPRGGREHWRKKAQDYLALARPAALRLRRSLVH